MVDMVGRAFTSLIKKTPDIIFVHNFNGAERRARYVFSAALSEQYQDINIVDMRDFIAEDVSDDEFQSWFIPSMREKWSNSGHLVYATFVAQVVLSHRSSKADQEEKSPALQ